jgi:hypothetical protein
MPNYEVEQSEYIIISIINYIPHRVGGNLTYYLPKPNTREACL